jgi:signal transduction histidine kinase
VIAFAVAIAGLLMFLDPRMQVESHDNVPLHGWNAEYPGTSWLVDGWQYLPGDSARWALPSAEDSTRQASPLLTPCRVPPHEYPDGGWKGIAWFRRWIDLDEEGYEPPLGMIIMLSGAAEVYLDGELIHSIGTVGTSPETERSVHHFRSNLVPLDVESGRHFLAVRMSHWQYKRFWDYTLNGTGFWFWVGDIEALSNFSTYRTRLLSKYMYFFTGAALAFSLLHLLLYAYYPAEKANLYYAIHTFSIAALTYVAFATNFTSSPEGFFFMFMVFQIAVVLTLLFALRFTYAVFFERPSRYYWFLLTAGVALIIVSPWVPLTVTYGYALVVFAEMVRSVILSIHRKHEGAWIVGIGLFLLVILATMQILSQLRFLPPFFETNYVYLYGMMGFIISMSILLARNSARTKQSLQKRLQEVQELSQRTVERERQLKEQEVERLKLQQENENARRELEVARERKKIMSDLEAANCELEQANKNIRETQAKLIQSEKMASLGTLVAGIAHEINTPIGAVHSMHDTLVRGIERMRKHVDENHPPDDPERQSYDKLLTIVDEANRVIHNGVDRVTTIVQRLRSFARLDEAELKEAEIEECLEDTLTLIHHEIKHRIEVVRKFEGVGSIRCYPGRLNQVFLNLLNNARQAISGEGTITIRTWRDETWVNISITDTGTGIPRMNVSKIFDPGYTTKGVRVGTGLGLSITYQIIVEEHRGHIDVESEEGQGTTFTVRLPINLGELIEGDEHE